MEQNKELQTHNNNKTKRNKKVTALQVLGFSKLRKTLFFCDIIMKSNKERHRFSHESNLLLQDTEAKCHLNRLTLLEINRLPQTVKNGLSFDGRDSLHSYVLYQWNLG